jgi:hypothetical protein
MDNNCFDINSCAHKYALATWNIILTNKPIAIFILFANFFFAILPAFILFFQKLRLVETEEKKKSNIKLPEFLSTLMNIFGITYFLLPLCVNLFQLIVFKRFISFRMTRTFFFGQLVAVPLYIICYVKYGLKKFTVFPLYINFIILASVYLVIFLIYLVTLSEFVLI